MGYVKREDRQQIIMFPDSMDDYVAEVTQLGLLKLLS
jgi:hypothetical protein